MKSVVRNWRDPTHHRKVKKKAYKDVYKRQTYDIIPREEWEVIEGCHEAIVTPEEWEQVQEVRIVYNLSLIHI